jgi:hypothetical protein
MKGDEIVGFLFGYPDPSAAIQRCKGKLFPLGWLAILIELRRTRWINLNGAGLLEKYRGSGGTALLLRCAKRAATLPLADVARSA